MSRFIPLLTAAFLVLLASVALATPTPLFTVSANPRVNVPVTFNGTASKCDAPPCAYFWRIENGTRLGINFSRTAVARYTFSQPKRYLVSLRVVNSNPRIGGPSRREATLYKYVTVAR